MNNIKHKLKKEYSVGTWMQIASEEVAEILSNQGFDWIALDLEHGVYDNSKILNCIRIIEKCDVVPMVRISDHSDRAVRVALDSGARGIIIPMIEDGETLHRLINKIYYPPQGNRGVGFARANTYGSNFEEYFNKINNEIVVVAQIENVSAIQQLDKILKVKGLDAIMIGPYDLSASMGQPGVFDERYNSVYKIIEENVKNSDVAMGVHVVKPDSEILKQKIADGHKFIAYGIDTLFLAEKAREVKNLL